MSRSWMPLLALTALACGASVDDGSTDDVVAEQVEGVWVFSFAVTPDGSMDALHAGEAQVVDGCLQIGAAVVVWREAQLPSVEDLVARLLDGEALRVELGGGGLSLEEGSTEADLPSAIVEHCTASEVWFAADGVPAVTSSSR